MIVGEGKGFGVARDPLESVQPAAINGAVASDGEHMFVQVTNGDVGLRVCFLFDAEGDITCAACYVEEFFVRLGADHGDKTVFPEAVDSCRHQIVHDVIACGYGVKDVTYEACLFFGGDRFFTELCALWIMSHLFSSLK